MEKTDHTGKNEVITDIFKDTRASEKQGLDARHKRKGW